MKAVIKKVFNSHPYVSRVLLALVLIVLAFILTGIIEHSLPIKKYFPFTGLVLLVVVTWLLYKTEGKGLNELGFSFSLRNLSLLLLGLLIGVIAFVSVKYLRFFYTGESLDFNDSYDWHLMAVGLYYILPMVAVEEFLFRGYLFKKTIEVSHVVLANVVFAIIFMLIHVVDENVLSNTRMVIFLVITIPIGHLLFATALLKSKTILFPIGLHWGNNWASFHIITDMQKQESLSFVSNPSSFETWGSFIGFLMIWNGFFLLLTYLIWRWPKGQKNALEVD